MATVLDCVLQLMYEYEFTRLTVMYELTLKRNVNAMRGLIFKNVCSFELIYIAFVYLFV